MSVKADTTGLEYQSAEWFEACAAIKRGQAAGSSAQYRPKDGSGKSWLRAISPAWIPECDYRLAPEPREVWVKLDDVGCLYHTESRARDGYIKFREVIE